MILIIIGRLDNVRTIVELTKILEWEEYKEAIEDLKRKKKDNGTMKAPRVSLY